MIHLFKNRLFIFILGGIIFSILTSFAYSYNAKDINYTPSNTSWKVNNIGDAIDSIKNTNDTKIANLQNDIQLKNQTIQEKDQTIEDLRNNSAQINGDNLYAFKSKKEINVVSGKKYLIVLTIISFPSQSYQPAILSGCNIIKETSMVTNSYSTYLYGASKSYIVLATSDKITIRGNNDDPSWNYISYYQF